MNVQKNWREFLAFGAPLTWDRLHTSQSEAEAAALACSRCTCSFDPMRVCPVHLCTCEKCGRGKGPVLDACAWRQSTKDFINQHFHDWTPADFSMDLSYIQTLELVHGRTGPQSPRLRTMLNVWARVPKLAGMPPCTLLDTSQTIGQGALRIDGMVPTITTSCSLLSMADGIVLKWYHMAALFGHKPEELHGLECVSESQMEAMLGDSIHLAAIGGVLMSGLAAIFDGMSAPAEPCLGE